MTTGRNIRDAMRRVLAAHSALDGERRPCGTPMSMAHAHALLTLRQAASPISVSTLARTVHIDRTNVSRLCARMEVLGEVERLPNPSDGRSKLIQLTNKGQELAGHVDVASARHFAAVVDALGDQAPVVLNTLTLLADALLGIESNPKRNAR